MVLAGQLRERPALVEAPGATLEALYHRGTRRPALLVCGPPGAGPGMDAPVVAELAWAAARAGHASLRFHYRGVGASTGAPDAARAVDDAEAACAHLSDTTGAPLGLSGVGAGAGIALALARAHPEVRRVVLIDPALVPPCAPGAPPPARILVILPERGATLDAESARALAGAQGDVEIVRGSDASWQSGLPAVAKAILAWLEAARVGP